MEQQQNYFVHQTAAKRYTQYRPYFHPLVIEKMRDFLQLKSRVRGALDVGCGTGQSALALLAVADTVQAIDTSAEMLARAIPDPRICYQQSTAEEMPFANASFDLITVSLAFHWFDRPRFLAGASRVLRPQGWLVIYNNGFCGSMVENDEFAKWSNDVYLQRYPTPSRRGALLTGNEVAPHGLSFVHQENYDNQVPFTKEILAGYLMTQSNVIAAAEQGQETVEGVYQWLLYELSPLLGDDAGTFDFSGYIWYVQS